MNETKAAVQHAHTEFRNGTEKAGQAVGQSNDLVGALRLMLKAINRVRVKTGQDDLEKIRNTIGASGQHFNTGIESLAAVTEGTASAHAQEAIRHGSRAHRLAVGSLAIGVDTEMTIPEKIIDLDQNLNSIESTLSQLTEMTQAVIQKAEGLHFEVGALESSGQLATTQVELYQRKI